MRKLVVILFSFLYSNIALAAPISSIEVEGNRKVEKAAVIAALESKVGSELNAKTIEDDIHNIYQLGFFSDIRIYKDGTKLIIRLKEKPSIVAIEYEGMDEVSEDDLEDKLESTVYSIVDMEAIQADVRTIETEYLQKGYYLAKISYELVPVENSDYEVKLIFKVEEGGKVLIGDVEVLGNKYFTDYELIEKFLSKPYTRTSIISAPGSIYNEEFVKRDTEIIGYLYKDQGFAEVQVGKTFKMIDQDRRFVQLTFQVEEGVQYKIGGIDISGDILYDKSEIKDWMKLKKGELFRFSFLRKDVETIIDKYGDKGFAYVDVNPRHRFDREKKLVYLNYEITNGDKVYFGDITFAGNTKTRDNVLRRELKIAEAELYSGTRLRKSKGNIQRLGYFDEVQAIRSRDKRNPSILNYEVRVKEKPTGQLQAAVGFSPNTNTSESQFFGQGRYSENNQSGYGWRANVTARWNTGKNYDFNLGWDNPRVDDSLWSLGVNGFLRSQVRRFTAGVEVQETRRGASIRVGRRIFEMINLSTAFKTSAIQQTSDGFILDTFKDEGRENSIIFSLSRNATNNFIDPSDGSKLRASQQISGGFLGGTRQYMETILDGAYFHPIDFNEGYRTYFRFHGRFGFLWPYEKANIPLFSRYLLGGAEDMRGWRFNEIGPTFNIMQSPNDRTLDIDKGGNKEFLFQAEYFVPIIPEANIKALVFYDAGNVFLEQQGLTLQDPYQDVGFGFRWITPVAPFRFEWAWQVSGDGKLSEKPNFIFYLGYE